MHLLLVGFLAALSALLVAGEAGGSPLEGERWNRVIECRSEPASTDTLVSRADRPIDEPSVVANHDYLARDVVGFVGLETEIEWEFGLALRSVRGMKIPRKRREPGRNWLRGGREARVSARVGEQWPPHRGPPRG